MRRSWRENIVNDEWTGLFHMLSLRTQSDIIRLISFALDSTEYLTVWTVNFISRAGRSISSSMLFTMRRNIERVCLLEQYFMYSALLKEIHK